ncbi:hypothetical protein C3L33_02397, partial [Rhododendron williamsianum]
GVPRRTKPRPVADDEAAAAGNGVTSSSEVALLAEDWRLSQFWYDPDTAETVAREVLSLCGPSSLLPFMNLCLIDLYNCMLIGGVQKDRAAELLDLYPCGFRPRHSSKLGNEFLLFTNYDPGMRLGGWERDQ